MTRRFAALTAAALLTTGSAACGKGDDQASVRDAFRTFFGAIAAGDGEKACAVLTPRGRTVVSTGAGSDIDTCPELIEHMADGFSDEDKAAIRRLDIRSAAVSGNRAIVRNGDVVYPEDVPAGMTAQEAKIVFVRSSSGAWQIDEGI